MKIDNKMASCNYQNTNEQGKKKQIEGNIVFEKQRTICKQSDIDNNLYFCILVTKLNLEPINFK